MYTCIDVNAYSYNRFALHCVTCHYVTLHYIAIRCVALYFTALHSITSPDITTLHYITSIAHCDSLYAIHCMTLRCIVFHSVPFHWYIHCMERHEPVLTPKIPQETSRFMLPCRTSMSAALEIRTCLGSSLPGSCGVGKVRRKTQLEKLWQYHGGTIRWMDGWMDRR